MPIFPYDDRLMLTPGFNPNLPNPISKRPMAPAPALPNIPRRMPGLPPESALPELATPNPVPMPTGVPGGMPPPVINPQTRAGEYQEAKDAYLQKTPGRLKSAILGGLRGLGPGLATGGLAGGLGGFAAGAGFGGINPRGLREQEFNERIMPQIGMRWQLEDSDRAQAAASAKAAADAAMNRMQMANISSQIESRNAADTLNQSKFNYETNKPFNVPAGGAVYDPRRGGAVFTATDPRQGAMTADQANATLTSQKGTVEEESQGSLEGRREMLKKHLTPDERRIIEGGTTTNDGPEAIKQARARWQKIQDDELNSIRRVTSEKRKTEATQKRFGRKGTPGRTAISVQEAAGLLK